MSEQWYYETGGAQTGPVDRKTLEILIAKNVISHKTLVWTEGMSEWLPASRVKGLVTAPPPMPGAKAPSRSTTGSVQVGASRRKTGEHASLPRRTASPVRNGKTPLLYAV